MPQPVAIQTEILPAVSAPTLGNKSPDSDKGTFSDALDAHMAKDQGGETSQLAKNGKIAEPQSEAAKTDAADPPVNSHEQNLPTETTDAAKSEQIDTVVDENVETIDASLTPEVIDVETEVAAQQGSEQAEASPEAVIEVETQNLDTAIVDDSDNQVGAEGGAQPTVTQEGVDEPEAQEITAVQKPIRATVEVAPQAVTNAQATPVEMVVKEKLESAPKVTPQSTTPSSTQTVVVSSDVDTQTTKETKGRAALLSTTPSPVKTGLTEADNKPSVTPEKTVAPTTEKNTVQPTALRADLMDALKRQPQNEMMTEKVKQALLSQVSEQGQKTSVNHSIISAAKLPELPSQTAATLASPIFSSPTTSSTVTGQAATSAATLSLPVQPTIQQAAWSKVMSSRVVWMAKEGVQQAELRMTPANLGPVEVRLQVQNEQASVTFLAQHSATREALEQALPKLREQFSEAGLELGQAEVGAQAQEQHETDDSEEAMIFSQANDTLDDTEVKEDLHQNNNDVATGISVYA
jgi:flagellar hook-length control protein FliK